MADAAFGKRFLWSIVWFCAVIFTFEADILEVRDVNDGYVVNIINKIEQRKK